MVMDLSAPVIVADSAIARSNAAVVVRFFSEVLGASHETAAVDSFLDPGFVDHDPAGDDNGVAGVVAKLAALWQAVPSGRYAPSVIIAAGDLVSVLSRLEVDDKGAGFADVYRLIDGRITEHWHVVDNAALTVLLESP
ncbi:Predicted SnoaL-like aldol condensation-catalyzing enzyme [Microbacterium sp. cf046]|uniref:nuclear transport factor 2 family protein n=1 Tax=Microbacterium sp. cf046 TaxID=1761803 RepID=UPI0008EBC7E9|nr:ester cyclase [Microbacterium sp. cf046]SFS17034.1 Predicted SnoaL-like aldol condensation-catalyzing enzyme [Microbacterium sp. cf046]